MSEYRDVSGTSFTDEDIERWGAEAESTEGYAGGHLGPSRPGRPVSVGAEARPFTLRLDAVRRAKLDTVAQTRHVTASQLVRELIDGLAEPALADDGKRTSGKGAKAVSTTVRSGRVDGDSKTAVGRALRKNASGKRLEK